MNYIKAQFLKDDKPDGRTYTYRTEDNVQPGDLVTDAKGSKLVVVGEADMEWVASYGKDKLSVVKKCEDSAAAGESEE